MINFRENILMELVVRLSSDDITKIVDLLVQRQPDISAASSQSKPEEGLLTVANLATYLNKSEKWVYEAVQEKLIPFLKLGKAIRFKKRDIDYWIDQHANAPQGREERIAARVRKISR